VWVAIFFLFVAEVEGLKRGRWGRSRSTHCSISLGLKEWRAIGCEFGVRLLLVHKLTTPVQRMRGRSFLSLRVVVIESFRVVFEVEGLKGGGCDRSNTLFPQFEVEEVEGDRF
jgi:hypothetical protein